MNFSFFDQLSSSFTSKVLIPNFILNLFLSAISCWILGQFYKKYGRTVSDRKSIASAVIYLGVITTFIISVVQSSIALSLGLVGSLSIVRFRTPVKEPEELLVLFASISLGLGFGANEPMLTGIVLCFILILMFLLNWRGAKTEERLISLHVAFEGSSPNFQMILGVLEPACIKLDLMRLDQQQEKQQFIFHLLPKNLEALEAAQQKLKSLNPSLSSSLLEFRPFG